MGLFSAIKDNWRKAEAAAMIESALEHLGKIPSLDVESPRMVANRVVDAAWTGKPELFNGQYGLRPGKYGVAGMALANAIEVLPPDSTLRSPLMIVLGQIFMAIEQHGPFIGLNSADEQLLACAAKVLGEQAAQLEYPWKARPEAEA